ncbi:MAG: HAD family hydrolase [Elusimicrobia bacterium]|nr:HAD family hydrolase [Elusimicrobiota bacterium]
MARWAVFLDRDGTLIDEVGYLSQPEQLKIIPGAPDAVKRLRDAGAAVIIVTNQAGVARGFFDEPGLKRVHDKLEELFAAEGARFDAIYYCPHHPEKNHPEANDPKYRVDCDCRKPKPGMVLQAAERFGVDVARSFLVGDTTRDVLTARNAGCSALLVETGYGGKDGHFNVRPDATCPNLAAAADWILGRISRR